MNIRLLKPKDIQAATRIIGINYCKEFEQSSTLELKAMFSDSPIKPRYYVAEDRGEIIGLAGYIQSWMDYNIYQIFWVNVRPERQNQGIGYKLVAKVIDRIKKEKEAYLILLTADSSVKNNVYYRKNFGFKSLQPFGSEPYHLMSLSINKPNSKKF